MKVLSVRFVLQHVLLGRADDCLRLTENTGGLMAEQSVQGVPCTRFFSLTRP
jgi:hypothetical protein